MLLKYEHNVPKNLLLHMISIKKNIEIIIFDTLLLMGRIPYIHVLPMYKN
jgi:hypothetical protein